MSELCSSKCHFSSLVFSDFILLCSFILSHPLYFSYFIFFSPYLLKLVSFLSPLFITTSLIFFAFLFHTQSPQTRFISILQRLQFNKDHHPNEELQSCDDLGIYEIVFGPPSMAAVREETPSQIIDQTPQKDPILEPILLPGPDKEAPIPVVEKVENSGDLLKVSETPVMEEKRMENFLKIIDDFERLASNIEEKKMIKQVEPSRGAKSDKVVEKQSSLFINGSDAATAACNANNNNQINDAATKLERSAMSRSNSQRMIRGDGETLSSYGSMRREREWKRTLACKLFEERHNNGSCGGGGEGMDSLWEAYEMDSNKPNKTIRRSKKGRTEKVNVREMEEDDEIGGQLCCLQALKMSAGKMNLGVGRPNLVKISKAIKGIGWLHNLTKNSKKVHNNGDHRY